MNLSYVKDTLSQFAKRFGKLYTFGLPFIPISYLPFTFYL